MTGAQGGAEFVLLSRPGCHLCDELRARAGPLLTARGFALREVDVDSDAALADRFGNEIPVLLDPTGNVLAKLRDTAEQMKRRLSRL